MINSIMKEARLIDKNRDKDIKIAAIKNYKHAQNTHFASLGETDMQEACKNYAIFFIGDETGIIPIALLGVKEGENLFVNKSGNWEKNYYIPAILRCYPFALAKSDDQGNFSIAYDAKYSGVNAKDGKNIFENGELNEYGNHIVDFVGRVYKDIESVKAKTALIKELGLFQNVDATIERDGKKAVINGLQRVDTQKLNDLKDEDLLKIAKSGTLNLIYSHLISLSNINALANKIEL